MNGSSRGVWTKRTRITTEKKTYTHEQMVYDEQRQPRRHHAQNGQNENRTDKTQQTEIIALCVIIQDDISLNIVFILPFEYAKTTRSVLCSVLARSLVLSLCWFSFKRKTNRFFFHFIRPTFAKNEPDEPTEVQRGRERKYKHHIFSTRWICVKLLVVAVVICIIELNVARRQITFIIFFECSNDIIVRIHTHTQIILYYFECNRQSICIYSNYSGYLFNLHY